MTETPDAEQSPVVQKLRNWEPQSILGAAIFRDELTLEVPPERLVHVGGFLKAEPELAFEFLSDISTVDFFPLAPRFELNYHLLSILHRQVVRVRTRLEGQNPEIASVTPLWPTANWHEREIFDLFGIRFEGHPDLRRILMPDDWEGHPLRKDYPVEGYR